LDLLIAPLIAETEKLDRAASELLALVNAGQCAIEDEGLHWDNNSAVELEVDNMASWRGRQIFGADIFEQDFVDGSGGEGVEAGVPEPMHVVDIFVEVDLLQPDRNLQPVGYRVVEILNPLTVAELALRDLP
jgi:hypothetical protein